LDAPLFLRTLRAQRSRLHLLVSASQEFDQSEDPWEGQDQQYDDDDEPPSPPRSARQPSCLRCGFDPERDDLSNALGEEAGVVIDGGSDVRVREPEALPERQLTLEIEAK
jgi:hypothetical protein